jgi:hypothetical protein
MTATREWTVAAERERCVEIVQTYLSPRAGIWLARQPRTVLQEILNKIKSGEERIRK